MARVALASGTPLALHQAYELATNAAVATAVVLASVVSGAYLESPLWATGIALAPLLLLLIPSPGFTWLAGPGRYAPVVAALALAAALDPLVASGGLSVLDLVRLAAAAPFHARALLRAVAPGPYPLGLVLPFLLALNAAVVLSAEPGVCLAGALALGYEIVAATTAYTHHI